MYSRFSGVNGLILAAPDSFTVTFVLPSVDSNLQYFTRLTILTENYSTNGFFVFKIS